MTENIFIGQKRNTTNDESEDFKEFKKPKIACDHNQNEREFCSNIKNNNLFDIKNDLSSVHNQNNFVTPYNIKLVEEDKEINKLTEKENINMPNTKIIHMKFMKINTETGNDINENEINEENKNKNKEENNILINKKIINKKKRNKLHKNRNNNNIEKFIKKNRNNNKKVKDKILEKGYEYFKSKNEYDLYLFIIILKLIINLNNLKEFDQDFSYYIYNNYRVLKISSEFNNIIKNPPNDELLLKESQKFYLDRFNRIVNSANKYRINLPQNNNELKNNKNINESKNGIKTNEKDTLNNNNLNNNNDCNNNSNLKFLNDEFSLELFVASLIYTSINRTQKELKENDINYKKGKDDINPIKFEISNFNMSNNSLLGVISGIKFLINITEIDLSFNAFNTISSFWLGSIFKTNPNIKKLDLTRCNLDNDCLYMLYEGSLYENKDLNNQQYSLDRLNLKDNWNIKDITNNKYEHPLCLFLQKFKLKWLNLTNVKIENSGTIKFFKTFINLLEQNKIYMENLILINNDFENEECLSIIGEALEYPDCPLQTIVLSKNLVTTQKQDNTNSINYFEKLMKSISRNKGLKELFLISCGIGKNKSDIDILYNMLCENKNLVSLRLFGNEINIMESFVKILEIFNNYKNNIKNNSLKSLDISKNKCNIKVDDNFLDLVDNLKLEYLDINQNSMEPNEKDIFRERTDKLKDIKIIY